MEKLKGYQRQYLKGLAHAMKPLVLIGAGGLSPTVVAALNEALEKHELIKVKFNDFKGREEKRGIVAVIEQAAGAEMVGMVGHIAIFYRRQPDADKRRIEVPQRPPR
ncbi:MAG: YhbY family RNA-binding protein [Deltaproteobacteria bacterium]|nr:YhbY family RNA-binding protein [Deltaproteobacteria bacterium]